MFPYAAPDIYARRLAPLAEEDGMETTARKKRVQIDRRTIGTHTELGTDWPIEAVVTRERRNLWALTIVCNGIAQSRPTYYYTKAEALKNLAEL